MDTKYTFGFFRYFLGLFALLFLWNCSDPYSGKRAIPAEYQAKWNGIEEQAFSLEEQGELRLKLVEESKKINELAVSDISPNLVNGINEIISNFKALNPNNESLDEQADKILEDLKTLDDEVERKMNSTSDYRERSNLSFFRSDFIWKYRNKIENLKFQKWIKEVGEKNRRLDDEFARLIREINDILDKNSKKLKEVAEGQERIGNMLQEISKILGKAK